jgi:flagella basal body P-ring formation protein FlgA
VRYLLTIVIVARLSAACVSVSGDRILAGDLARAVPEFQQADASQVIGYAPLPGTQRGFSSKEIGLWALRLHLEYHPQEFEKVCFERASRVLTLEEIQSAVREALKMREAYIEVLDFSRSSVPPGRVEFQLSGAGHSSAEAQAAPILWRGRILTESGRSFPIWTRVRVSVEVQQIVATVALARGQTLGADQVSVIHVLSSPFAAGHSQSIDAVIGRVVKRDIAKGQPIPATALEEPRDVLPGDVVHVEAQNGQAQISFEAKAKTGGRRGDSISMQNPVNGRPFQAVIIDKGKVQAKASSK